MSDKLQKTVSVAPTFVDGEQPPAAKFTVLGAQIRVATEALEKALGDVQDQSWPYHASITTRLSPPYGRHARTGAAMGGERFAGIANLSRLIGSAANLNPRSLGTTEIVDTLGDGLHEFQLTYPPDDPVAGLAFSIGGFTTYVADETQLSAAGEYSVSTNGRIWAVTASVSPFTVTYNTTPADYAGGPNYSGASFNVIPDPNQTQTGIAADSVLVVGPDVQGKYAVSLPTACSAQQSNYVGTSVTLGARDLTMGEALELPGVLSAYAAGDPIPNGFVALRDNDLNETYPDATYEYVSQTQFLISGVDLTIANEFSVLTVGTDITTSIDDLRFKSRHNHTGNHGEPGIPVAALVDVISEPGASGGWVPSEMPGNFAPQYLHRDGFQGPLDSNLNDSNAMRGPLFLAAEGAAGTMVPIGVQADNSHPIIFGNIGTYIRSGSPSDGYIGLDYVVLGGRHDFRDGPVTARQGYYGVRDDTYSGSVSGFTVDPTKKPTHMMSFTGGTITIDGGAGNTLNISSLLPSASCLVVGVDLFLFDTGTSWYPANREGVPRVRMYIDSSAGWNIKLTWPNAADWNGGDGSTHAVRFIVFYTEV